MSKLFDDASLAMIPSAYKDGKLYSIRPTDGDGDFTFSRGSNLAATRVDVNGLIEKGRENQILYSQDFSNAAWSKGSHTIVSNAAVAPNGTTTADKLVADNGLDPSVANSSGVFQNRTIPTSLYSISVYAKAAEFTSIRFRENYVVGSLLTIDLTDGSITGGGSQYSDVKAVSVGNGWYRISFFYNQTTGNPAKYTLRCADTGDGTSGVYIWGYQQEQGLVATDYIETGTSAAQSGILEDMPRLDYSGSCPALLLEPQRTNVATYSEYFGAWNTRGTASVSDNQGVSPEGVQNAALLDFGSTTLGANRIDLEPSISAGANYVFSVFVKNIDANRICIRNYNSTKDAIANFDFSSGSFTDTNVNVIDTIVEPYDNDWYRIGIVVNSGVDTTADMRISPDTTSGSDGEQVYIYGVQFEQGSYPTSYIPTYGTSQTRTEELCYQSPLATLSNNYSIFAEVTRTAASEINNLEFLDYRSSGNDRLRIYTYNNGRIRFRTYFNDGTNDSYFTNSSDWNQGDTIKFCFTYDNGSIVIYANGEQLHSVSQTLNNLNYLNMETQKIKQVLHFETTLTSSEAIALTTI